MGSNIDGVRSQVEDVDFPNLRVREYRRDDDMEKLA